MPTAQVNASMIHKSLISRETDHKMKIFNHQKQELLF